MATLRSEGEFVKLSNNIISIETYRKNGDIHFTFESGIIYPYHELKSRSYNWSSSQYPDSHIYNQIIQMLLKNVRNAVNECMDCSNVTKELVLQKMEYPMEQKSIMQDLYALQLGNRKYKSLYNTLLEFIAYSEEYLDYTSWGKLKVDKFLQFSLLVKSQTQHQVMRNLAMLRKFLDPNQMIDRNALFFEPLEADYTIPNFGEIQAVFRSTIPTHMEKAFDLMQFIAFTGISFEETQTDIIYTLDHFYIMLEKTSRSRMYNILRPAEHILQKYNGDMPKMPREMFNIYIKGLFRVAGLDREVPTHIIQNKIRYNMEYPLQDVVDVHTVQRMFISICLFYDVDYKDLMRLAGVPDYHILLPFIEQDRDYKATIQIEETQSLDF